MGLILCWLCFLSLQESLILVAIGRAVHFTQLTWLIYSRHVGTVCWEIGRRRNVEVVRRHARSEDAVPHLHA